MQEVLHKRDSIKAVLAACCISTASVIHGGFPNRIETSNRVDKVAETSVLHGRAEHANSGLHRLLRGKSDNNRSVKRAEIRATNVPIGASVVGNYGKEYIIVSKVLPETLYLIYKGRVVFESKANTGIPQSPTPNGEFHVYRKYWSTTMSGFNPATREWYDDPGVKYVMYFHYGDAIHAFPRKGYGWPQSLGCVELPLKAAGWLFLRVKDGTNVIIENGRPKIVDDDKSK